jgi:hypothetical protein
MGPFTASLLALQTDIRAVPLSPPIPLFDPSLGTLVSVEVRDWVNVRPMITSRNLNMSATATVTATATARFELDGFVYPIVQDTEAATSGPMSVGPGQLISYDPTTLGHARLTEFDDLNSLISFTATPGRTSIQPTLTASAAAFATGSSNVLTTARTLVDATVAVTYEYLPPAMSFPVPSAPNLPTQSHHPRGHHDRHHREPRPILGRPPAPRAPRDDRRAPPSDQPHHD